MTPEATVLDRRAATSPRQDRLPMRIVLLTNDVPAYRRSTLAALAGSIESLTVVLAGRVCPGTASAAAAAEAARGSTAASASGDHTESHALRSPLLVPIALMKARARHVVSSELGLRTAMALLYRTLARDCRLIVHADLSQETEQYRGGLRSMLRRMLLRRVDWVMVNGLSGERYVRSLGFPAARISRLPYATDLTQFGAASGRARDAASGDATADGAAQPTTHRLLYVGRLVDVKGLERFITALADFLRRRPDLDVSLTLAGDGDRREAIEAMPRPSNLRLRLLGAVRYESLPTVYADADAFVFPSVSDTWGLVVNEAMASGLPVLGSIRAQAVDELVEDDASGWRFDPLDDATVDAALQRFFRAPAAVRRQMGRRAREVALALSPQDVAARIVDACRRSVDGC